MYYVNTVRLIGCLGRDPEIRTFNNGGKVANLRLATTEHWKDKNTGERRERTEWHQIAVTNPALVENVERYLKKGAYLEIQGKLQTRKWQDQSGQDRYTTEIVVGGYDGAIGFLDRQGGTGRQGGDQGGGQDQGGGRPQGGQSGPQGGGGRQDYDDEIPF